MTAYELIFIIKAGLEEAKQTEVAEKVKALIEAQGGKIINYEFMGKRELATPFEKQTHGVYILIDYEGAGEINGQLTQHFKITEEIIRHLIVKQEKIRETKKAKKNKKIAATAEVKSA